MALIISPLAHGDNYHDNDTDDDYDNAGAKDDDDNNPPLSQAASTFISRAPPLLRYHCCGHSASVHLFMRMMVMVMAMLMVMVMVAMLMIDAHLLPLDDDVSLFSSLKSADISFTIGLGLGGPRGPNRSRNSSRVAGNLWVPIGNLEKIC